MKKFLFCAVFILAIIGFAFKLGGYQTPQGSDGPMSVTEAAFEMRSADHTSDATAFLIGTFDGDDGTKLRFDGKGGVRKQESYTTSYEGEYAMTQAQKSAILSMSFQGETTLYSFTLLSPQGNFELVAENGDTVVYTPIE